MDHFALLPIEVLETVITHMDTASRFRFKSTCRLHYSILENEKYWNNHFNQVLRSFSVIPGHSPVATSKVYLKQLSMHRTIARRFQALSLYVCASCLQSISHEKVCVTHKLRITGKNLCFSCVTRSPKFVTRQQAESLLSQEFSREDAESCLFLLEERTISNKSQSSSIYYSRQDLDKNCWKWGKTGVVFTPS